MKTALTVIALICMVACTTSPPQTAPAQVSSAPGSATGFASDLNAFRASQGRSAMRPNAALARAAQAHAEDMARRGYFSHDSPGGPNGDSFADRARAGGCAMTGGAENIASGQRSEDQVLVAWQNSAGHRRNMLVGGYTQFGLGRSGNIWVLKLAQSC